MIFGKYGDMILENMEKNYPYRKQDLEITGELNLKIFQKEKEIIAKKEEILNELIKEYPQPKSNEILVISKYQQMIDALVEERLMPYILEKI